MMQQSWLLTFRIKCHHISSLWTFASDFVVIKLTKSLSYAPKSFFLRSHWPSALIFAEIKSLACSSLCPSECLCWMKRNELWKVLIYHRHMHLTFGLCLPKSNQFISESRRTFALNLKNLVKTADTENVMALAQRHGKQEQWEGFHADFHSCIRRFLYFTAQCHCLCGIKMTSQASELCVEHWHCFILLSNKQWNNWPGLAARLFFDIGLRTSS